MEQEINSEKEIAVEIENNSQLKIREFEKLNALTEILNR